MRASVKYRRERSHSGQTAIMSMDRGYEPFLSDSGYTQNVAARDLDLGDRLLARCRLLPCWNPSCIAKSRTWYRLESLVDDTSLQLCVLFAGILVKFVFLTH